MKIDRLMAILTILLQNDKVTAPWLADKLEVSRRTIGWDLEVLYQAGIPVVTEQGFGGGISLALERLREDVRREAFEMLHRYDKTKQT